MLNGDDCDDGHVLSFGFERNVHDDFVDAAVGEEQEAIGRAEDKVTQDDLTETLDVFEEHRLALPVRTDDEVVIREREFDDGMEAGETAVTREHLFDENARVSRAEEMDKPIARDALRAKVGGAFDGVELSRFDALEDGFGLN